MLLIRRQLFYRTNPREKTPWPLSVRSVGCYEAPRGWQETSRPKWFCQLFWTIKGRGCFRLGPNRYEAGAGDVFYYIPGEPHEIISHGDPWRYRWFTCDGPDAVRWLESFGLHERKSHVGACPEHEFRKIESGLRNGTPQGERRASLAAYALLGSVMDGLAQKPGNLAARVRQELNLGVDQISVNVSSVAEKLGIHRSSLYRLFHKEYGIAPQCYLANLRIQRAISLLRETPMPLIEIATCCGFSDPDYLSKTLRKLTGQSPREIRRAQNQAHLPIKG